LTSMGKFSRFPLPLAAGDVEDAIPYMRLSFITMTLFSATGSIGRLQAIVLWNRRGPCRFGEIIV